MATKWIEPGTLSSNQALENIYRNTPLILNQFAKKGISSIQEAEHFLNPTVKDLATPFEFGDAEKAAARLITAILNNENIGIWGDFDVDGQTSTAILVDGLRKLGANICYHIPIRKYESHGMNLASLKSFIARNKPELMVTCDTGITEHNSIGFLSSLGIDTIITDHHTPTDELPVAFAIINPQLLNKNHPLHTLAGVGTAFQLIRALFQILKRGTDEESDYYDLVALGTIADVASLTGDNRFYTKAGLRKMNQHLREALREISTSAGFRNMLINETDIGFTFAPRMNAIGRLGDANPVVEFLLSKDKKSITRFAEELEEFNLKRKLAVAMVYDSALEQLTRRSELLQYPIIIIERENWEKGVVGIAASRLAEKYQKPVILLNCERGIASGSARSIEGVNLIKAIQESSHYLENFGGHPMAAGLSIRTENIPEFREEVSKSIAVMMQGKDLAKRLEIDAYITFTQHTKSLLDEIEQLAPFGNGNQQPVFVTTNLEIESYSSIGKAGDHRQLTIKDQHGNVRNILWWGSSEIPLPVGPFDLAYTIRPSHADTNLSVLLEWLDFRESRNHSIDFSRIPEKYKIHDYRKLLNQKEIAAILLNCSGLQIWAEGIKLKTIPAHNRLEVSKSKALAILTAPPDRSTLSEIIRTANPDEIFLFNLKPENDPDKSFFKKLAGMVQFCLANKKGVTTLPELRSALCQTNETILSGLNLLKASGKIDYQNIENQISISKAANARSLNFEAVENNLKRCLDETSAFRSFYSRLNDPRNLFAGN